MIVTLAPTVGPTLGGHLTDWLNWRWLFFINVVPGLLSLFLVGRYGNFDKGDRRLAQNFDWFGLAMMAIFLMSMQYVVEEGAKDNWFQDTAILWLTVLASVTGVIFVWRQLTYFQPIVQLKAIADRNFALGLVMGATSGLALYGGTFVLPIYLGRCRSTWAGSAAFRRPRSAPPCWCPGFPCSSPARWPDAGCGRSTRAFPSSLATAWSPGACGWATT